jgi:hypothetical protein
VKHGWTEYPEPLSFEVEVSTDDRQEINPTNNKWRTALGPFHRTKPVNLMFVPIRTKRADGSFCDYPTDQDFNETAQMLLRIWPIERARYWKLPGIRVDKPDAVLLAKLYALNFVTNDPASDMRYFGLVCRETDPDVFGDDLLRGKGLRPPFEDAELGVPLANEAWGFRWHEKRTAHTYGGTTMAHELAHTLGHGHSPCGDIKAPKDDNYPHPGASISEYGFENAHRPSPKMKVYDPDRNKDYMSYCRDEVRWISDYNYRRVFNRYRALP